MCAENNSSKSKKGIDDIEITEWITQEIPGDGYGSVEGVFYSGSICVATVDGKSVTAEFQDELLLCDNFDRVETVEDLYGEFERLFNGRFDKPFFADIFQIKSLSDIAYISLDSNESEGDAFSTGGYVYDFIKRSYRITPDGYRY